MTKAFHPARREHAEQFIAALATPKDQKYATKVLDYIWSGKGKTLYAIFATLR